MEQKQQFAQVIAEALIGAFGGNAFLTPPNPKKYTIKALKQYIGKKGARCDFFAENEGLVWSCRWVRNKPTRLKREVIDKIWNDWETEGNLWRPSRKYDYQWFLTTPDGLLIKTLVRVKDKKYLGSAGEQPKATTKDKGAPNKGS